ncbi:hypothetical protein AVEN_56059-1 [Araneus ventricosus]|uniref:Retrovirus-related Pol polyprotein from transposon TNT 1-94-like beta-barrel domain-containing protein n=1 Tax=Araneus ventricosus TaxID=182803 RepID=A0A4Y2M469_ARAVE|nr:hypothetical protein AVEN_211078-1 [Araneus ventricosus]GBN21771.1 hypothetical protein AVEN_56059-1 [Araneus ventricosus]
MEVQKQLINEAGRIQLKHKDLHHNSTENAYNVGSFRQQEINKKYFEHSEAVLDPSSKSCQYKKNRNPKGMGPFSKYCSRKGHIVSKCYKKRNKEEKQAFVSETSFCLINQSVGAFGVSKNLEKSLIDSAATSHFCCERDCFKNFKELSTTKALLADKNYACEVKVVGDIDFIIRDNKCNVQITLKDVFYAPDMRKNVISGAKMDIAGFKISWANNVTAFRQEMLYILYGYPLLENVMYTSINLIHRRLGHVNIPTIKETSKNQPVKGLEQINFKMVNQPYISHNTGKAT